MINKIVDEALKEPATNIKGLMVGELKEDGAYYNGKRVL